MKKAYLLFVLILTGFLAQSQVCIPDNSFTNPGYYPDSLAPATINQPYEQVVTVIVPADTTIELIPGFPTTLPIDSIVLTSIINLPPGFSFECAPSSCGFPGGSTGCMKVTGNPLTGVGEYNLIVNVMAYSAQAGSLSPLAETINFGKFIIFDNVSVGEISNNRFKIKSIIPQPFANTGKLNYTAYKPGEIDLTIMNIVGDVVYQNQYLVNRGEGTLEISPNLSSGLYLISVEKEGYSTVEKFVVSK